MYWLALAALLFACWTDLRKREIPDALSLCLLFAALGAKALGWHPVGWTGILLGCGLAFGVSFALFALGGLGGGDVKLLTALGATLGWPALLPFALLTGIFGGVAAWIARRKRQTEVAYAPVMLAGLLALLPLVWITR